MSTAYVALLDAIKSDRGKKLRAYIKHPVGLTKAIRKYVGQRDNHTCQLCGVAEGKRAFNVHHEDDNRMNNDPDNLVTLCQQCHAYVHQTRLEQEDNRNDNNK